MAVGMVCRVRGCDPDPCGICRRCGDAVAATHDWKEAERERPCFRIETCTRCAERREQPDHDWEMGTDAIGDPSLKCSRCGLLI